MTNSCFAIPGTSCSTKSASKARKSSSRHVLIVGAGGLGSPVALYLGSAGVGHITIADHDRVDATNLQRQIAHTLDRVGEFKAESTRQAIAAINPDVKVTPITSAPRAPCWTAWSQKPTWCSTAPTTSPPATPSTAPA
jgi:tRNA A37 threonylcarbamoyladenosine dehydratase